jgi:hypothetical protein
MPLSAQRCINLYPVIPQATALNQRALFGCPGTKTHPVSGATIVGSNRGSQVMKGVGYFVNGSRLYSVTKSGVIVDLGSITGSGRVSLANNGQFIVIVVPGGDSFGFDNVANTLTQITSLNFRTSSTVVFKDGFFAF